MSILIKGMEMPTRCGRCDMRIPAYDDGIFDHYECCITAAIIDNLGEKMEDCPIVPVPPHGDLIGRDALIKVLKTKAKNPLNEKTTPYSWAFAYECLADVVGDMPTIIPAEEGE